MHVLGRSLAKVLCAAMWIAPRLNGATDAALNIVTRNNQTKFQMGEVIPIDLSFTARTASRFSINMAHYDRSGRIRWETFVVSPTAGTADPLAFYFNSSRVFLRGGLTNFQYLSTEPVQINLH